MRKSVSSSRRSSTREPGRAGSGCHRHRSLRRAANRRTWPLGESYRPLVEGRAALVSFVTAAELRFGARLGGWGPQRLRLLDRELKRAETIWPGLELVDAYVTLRYWCVRAGHALGQKHHEADRWVAATAMWLAVPLVAHDAIFVGVEGLNLLTKLGL